jgi:hypothetical protein
MTRGEEAKKRIGREKVILIYFSNAAVSRFRPTNEKCLTMQTRFHHWDNPIVGI